MSFFGFFRVASFISLLFVAFVLVIGCTRQEEEPVTEEATVEETTVEAVEEPEPAPNEVVEIEVSDEATTGEEETQTEEMENKSEGTETKSE